MASCFALNSVTIHLKTIQSQGSGAIVFNFSDALPFDSLSLSLF
jgi:hypothetical protein